MWKKRKLALGDARSKRCCFGMTMSPNMDQLVTRECVRVLSLRAAVFWPIRIGAQLLYVHCVDNSLSCSFLRVGEVCFSGQRSGSYVMKGMKFRENRTRTDWSCRILGGKTRKFLRTLQIIQTLDRMPRVVAEQRQKFENDDLFRKMSRESEVIWQFQRYMTKL